MWVVESIRGLYDFKKYLFKYSEESLSAFEEEAGSNLVLFSKTQFVSSLRRPIPTLFPVISNSLFAYWFSTDTCPSGTGIHFSLQWQSWKGD